MLTEREHAPARFEQRHRGERWIARPEVSAASGHGSVEEDTAAAVERMGTVAHGMLDELPVPCLRVDTTDRDDPGLDEIVAVAVTGS